MDYVNLQYSVPSCYFLGIVVLVMIVVLMVVMVVIEVACLRMLDWLVPP